MSDFHLGLGLLSMTLLFVAGLLVLLCQYWRSRRVMSVAIALGILGGLGVVGFFGALLFPAEVLAQLAQWCGQNAIALNSGAIGFCVWLAYWREQQDRRRGITWGLYGQQPRTYDRPRPASPHHSSPKREKHRPQPRHNRQQGTSTTLRRQSPAAGSWRSRWRTGKLLRQLNALTHDGQTSERLIRSILDANPGRDRPWAVERAIADLERDRRA